MGKCIPPPCPHREGVWVESLKTKGRCDLLPPALSLCSPQSLTMRRALSR